jgi:hypothetical protein
MEAQEVVVSADEPADTSCDRTGDELGIVRISDYGDDRWWHCDGFDECFNGLWDRLLAMPNPNRFTVDEDECP